MLEYNAIDPPTNRETRTDKCWYLPAQLELEGFMMLVANRSNGQIATNINDQDKWYWSSTLGENSTDKTAYAFCYGLNETGDNLTYKPTILNREKDITARIRQARRFPEEYEYAW